MDEADHRGEHNEDTASGGGHEVKAAPMDLTPADRIARLQERARQMAERARRDRRGAD